MGYSARVFWNFPKKFRAIFQIFGRTFINNNWGFVQTAIVRAATLLGCCNDLTTRAKGPQVKLWLRS